MTKTEGDMVEHVCVWVYSVKSGESVLFACNPNLGIAPYHIGPLTEVLEGSRLLLGYTRYDLVYKYGHCAKEWNSQWPKCKVSPRRVYLEWVIKGRR